MLLGHSLLLEASGVSFKFLRAGAGLFCWVSGLSLVGEWGGCLQTCPGFTGMWQVPVGENWWLCEDLFCDFGISAITPLCLP